MGNCLVLPKDSDYDGRINAEGCPYYEDKFTKRLRPVREVSISLAYILTGLAIMGIGLGIAPAMDYMAKTNPSVPSAPIFANVVSNVVMLVSFGWCLYLVAKGSIKLDNMVIKVLRIRFSHLRKGARALIELVGLCLTIGGFILVVVKMIPFTINHDAPPPDTIAIIAMIIGMVAFISGFTLVESTESKKETTGG